VASGDPGSYALTGTDATLTYTPSGGGTSVWAPGVWASGVWADGVWAEADGATSLATDPGSYALTGVAADLRVGHVLVTDAGVYALTGTDSTLQALSADELSADPGSYSVTGADAALRYGRVLPTDAGAAGMGDAGAALPQTGAEASGLMLPALALLALLATPALAGCGSGESGGQGGAQAPAADVEQPGELGQLVPGCRSIQTVPGVVVPRSEFNASILIPGNKHVVGIFIAGACPAAAGQREQGHQGQR
jgi:hypothetical protein